MDNIIIGKLYSEGKYKTVANIIYSDDEISRRLKYQSPTTIIKGYHIIANSSTDKSIALAFAGIPKDFFKNLTDTLGLGVTEVINIFKNWKIVKFFSKVKWNFKKIYELLANGRKILAKIEGPIKKFIEENKIVKFTKDNLEKLDSFIKQHPVLSRVAGVAVASLLVYIWFNMTFTGDPKYDFGMDSILDALSGKFSLADIFGGYDGIKLLALFATGLVGLSFPWPGPGTIQFISAILATLIKKLKIHGTQVKMGTLPQLL